MKIIFYRLKRKGNFFVAEKRKVRMYVFMILTFPLMVFLILLRMLHDRYISIFQIYDKKIEVPSKAFITNKSRKQMLKTLIK